MLEAEERNTSLAAARDGAEHAAAELRRRVEDSLAAGQLAEARADRAEGRARELEQALQAAQRERQRVEAELQARAARAETRSQELASRAEAAAREAGLAQAARARVQEVEAQLLAAGQARARLEKELTARASAAEARAVDGARRIEQLAAERREAEARAVKAVEEAQARFRDELTRRDQLRADEIDRLQTALQERARREKTLELELQRAKGGRNVVQPQPATPPAATSPAVTDEE